MKKLYKKIGIAIGVSLLILLGITVFTSDETTLEALKDINKFYIIILVLVVFSIWFLNGFILKILAHGANFKLSLITSIEVGLVDKFFTNITPSGLGGQPVKIFALSKTGISSGKITAIIIVEMFCNFIFYILGLLILFFRLKQVFVQYISSDILLIILLVLPVIIILVLYLFLYRPSLLSRIFFLLLKLPILKKLFGSKKLYILKRKIVKEVKMFYETIWKYVSHGKIELIAAIILTSIKWIIQFSIVYFIVKGLNYDIDLLNIIVVQLLVYAMTLLIPLPGGSGIEIVMATVLQQFLPISIIGIVVAAWRFFTYYAYIIVGGIITVKVFKIKDELFS